MPADGFDRTSVTSFGSLAAVTLIEADTGPTRPGAIAGDELQALQFKSGARSQLDDKKNGRCWM
jgi:hypothetical protein